MDDERPPEVAQEASYSRAFRRWRKMHDEALAVFYVGPVTYNEIARLAERITVLADTMRREILTDKADDEQTLATEHLGWWRHHGFMRKYCPGHCMALVRADPVPCPACDGRGGFGWGENAEGCNVCGMQKTLPRCLAERYVVQCELAALIIPPWLDTIEAIDVL